MVGVIWFVQVVHYPLFAAVGRDGFADYELAHQRRTAFVVGPLMGWKASLRLRWSSLAPTVCGSPGPHRAAPPRQSHASTVLLQVPAHRALADGFAEATRHLRTNWIRTAGWTLRGLVAVVMTMSVAA
jgi:hypothetical protein